MIPEQKNRRSSLYLHRKVQNVDFEWGACGRSREQGSLLIMLWKQKSRSYNNSGYHVVQDQTYWLDTLGNQATKIKTSLGFTLLYAQAGYQGLLADGGGDPTITYTGWRLKS